MAKEYAKKFYGSSNWQKIRDAYYKQVGGLCERCYAKGIIKAGQIVHHRKHITPNNINNANITSNFSNLELLCRDCHSEEHHFESKPKDFIYKGRYKIGRDGNVTIIREE